MLPVRTDVSQAQQVEALARAALDEFGGVHILCNNAGVGGAAGLVWERTIADWQWVLGVNLWGVIHGVRTFIPIMLRQGTEGHIVNTASMAGLLSIPMLATYGVTKHGVVTLSESLYLELQSIGAPIGVSVLCPGFVNTNIADSARNRPPELANEGGEPELTPQQQAAQEMMRAMLRSGMSPAAVADRVLAAIRDERFYVLTHPEMKPAVEDRMRRILDDENPAFRGLFAAPQPGN